MADVSDHFRGSGFAIFANLLQNEGIEVRAIPAPTGGSRKFADRMNAFAQKEGLPGWATLAQGRGWNDRGRRSIARPSGRRGPNVRTNWGWTWACRLLLAGKAESLNGGGPRPARSATSLA